MLIKNVSLTSRSIDKRIYIMANQSTKRARLAGYSDTKRWKSDNERNPTLKNYKVKTGITVDSEGAKMRSGKTPRGENERYQNDGHWTQPDHGRSENK